jgi:hypothetical protein
VSVARVASTVGDLLFVQWLLTCSCIFRLIYIHFCIMSNNQRTCKSQLPSGQEGQEGDEDVDGVVLVDGEGGPEGGRLEYTGRHWNGIIKWGLGLVKGGGLIQGKRIAKRGEKMFGLRGWGSGETGDQAGKVSFQLNATRCGEHQW